LFGAVSESARLGQGGRFAVERQRDEVGAAVIVGDQTIEQTAATVGLQGIEVSIP